MAVAAIVAAAALTGVAFAIPQQVMAGGYGHRHGHNHNNHSNNIKVDQAVNQLNNCSSTPPEKTAAGAFSTDNGGSGTTCLNFGSNSADIHTHR